MSRDVPNGLSFGTLVSCSRDEICLWSDDHGNLVQKEAILDLMLSKVLKSQRIIASHNLVAHIEYLQNVLIHANLLNYQLPYHIGLTSRHISMSLDRALSPAKLAHRQLSLYRHLYTPSNSVLHYSSNPKRTLQSGSIPIFLNWCSTSNPLSRDVCSTVKSQETCGSCWAFAAADAIETAVSINSNTPAVALSPQQLLQCSSRSTIQKFKYCWATSRIQGAPWITEEVTWESKNDGCDGGMTHGAFMDIAQFAMGLVTELRLPYDNDQSAKKMQANDMCQVAANDTAASITGWEQIVGKDCSASQSVSELLKIALQKQPIAVAINSEDPFNDYKGGFFTCPNNGDFPTKDDLNHALVLVGYGVDEKHGEYWILKNSYGSSWGEKGFLKLLADSKLNCGLNVFPVIPTGAKAGATSLAVDGGGKEEYLGLKGGAWIGLAAALGAITIILTVIGLVYVRMRRKAIRGGVYDQNRT